MKQDLSIRLVAGKNAPRYNEAGFELACEEAITMRFDGDAMIGCSAGRYEHHKRGSGGKLNRERQLKSDRLRCSRNRLRSLTAFALACALAAVGVVEEP